MALLKRTETTPSTPVETGGTDHLLLGEGAEFEGKLTFKGTTRIHARFKGTITTEDVLIVGESARIDAEITCGTVIVHGEGNGNIRAKVAVELRASAKVRGDISTPSLTMERGVILQGAVKMENLNEKASAPARQATGPAPAKNVMAAAAAP